MSGVTIKCVCGGRPYAFKTRQYNVMPKVHKAGAHRALLATVPYYISVIHRFLLKLHLQYTDIAKQKYVKQK